MHRPRLRPHVTLERDGDSTWLRDPVLDHRVELGRIGQALAARLDGTSTPDELLGALVGTVADAAGAPYPRANFERALRTFYLLNLVEGAGDPIVARVARLKDGRDQLSYHVLAESRFACQGSGECCQNYWLGPIHEPDVARLRALPLADAFPHLGGVYTTEREVEGRSHTYLRGEDDRCVFLEGHLCGLHARFGADAKPAMCRTYPVEQTATLVGVKVYDKGSCARFSTSARSGPPLAQDLPRLFPLLGNRHDLFHPILRLHDGRAGIECDYGHFARLAASLQDLPRGVAGAAETLREVGRRARRFAAALAACPLDDGEPDRTVAACLADPSAPADADAVPRGLASLVHVTEALLGACAALLRHSYRKSGHEYIGARLVQKIVPILHVVQGVAAHRLAPDENPLPPAYARAAARPLDDPDLDAVLRLSLLGQIFGDGLLLSNSMGAGLLHLGLLFLCAGFGARLVDGAIAATDLDLGHMLAHRVLGVGEPAAILARHEAHAFDVLEAVVALWRA